MHIFWISSETLFYYVARNTATQNNVGEMDEPEQNRSYCSVSVSSNFAIFRNKQAIKTKQKQKRKENEIV